jgi:hypothetical protein
MVATLQKASSSRLGAGRCLKDAASFGPDRQSGISRRAPFEWPPLCHPPIVEALPEFICSISGRKKCRRREPYRSPPTGQWCCMIRRHAKDACAIAGFAA